MGIRRRQIDDRIQVVTPENIAFEYRIAGPFYRFPALVIDIAIRIAAVVLSFTFVGIVFATAGLEGLGFAFSLLLWFVLDWFYGGLFETFWNGQTPGKKLMGIRVVSVDGHPITAMQAVMRNVLRAVDSIPIFPAALFGAIPLPVPCYLVGLVAMAMTPRFQRLGDLACGTMVIIEQRPRLRGMARIENQAVHALAERIPLNLTIPRSLARALSMYVERRDTIHAARREEIARHLGDVLSQSDWFANLAVPAMGASAAPADVAHLAYENARRSGQPPERMRRAPVPKFNHDVLLCALYYHAFLADQRRRESEQPALEPLQPSPVKFLAELPALSIPLEPRS